MAVRASDARPVADAARRLAAHPANPRPGDVGVAAISYAAGPALLAARETPEMRWLALLGGYADAAHVVRFTTTGAHRGPSEAAWRYGTPRPEATWLFAEANAAFLDDPHEGARLATVARHRAQGATAGVPESELGPQGRAVMALMLNRQPGRVDALIAALPERLRAELQALSPLRAGLGGIAGCVLLLHGTADPVIPWTEARWLAASLPRARVLLLEDFSHIRPAAPGEAATQGLLAGTSALLALRDGHDPCAEPPS